MSSSHGALKQIGTVVHADGWAAGGGQCVRYPDSAGLHHVPFSLVNGEPGYLPRLAAGARLPADDTAPERERDHAADHVLVDAGEPVGPDLDAGFLQHLARDA